MTRERETGRVSSPGEAGGGLRRGTMGVSGMVVAVIAFAAPLAASVGSIPLAIGLGDGAGAPGAWLLAAITLLLFAVGYAAMSRHMTNAGAFYAYIAAGLGRRCGVATGYLSVVAYSGLVFAVSAFFGFFASTVLETELSIHVPWFPLSILGVLAAGVLAFTGVEASVRAMMILLGVETALLVVFTAGTLVVAAREPIRSRRSRRRRSSAARSESHWRSPSPPSSVSKRPRFSPRKPRTRSAPYAGRRTTRSPSSPSSTPPPRGP